jgi:exosortase A
VPSGWGLFTIAALSLVWFVANLGDVKALQEFAVVGMLCAAIWAQGGSEVAWGLRFPLALLFFAVPFGDSLIAPLQDFTAWFAIHALVLSKVPAVMENHTIFLPSGQWTVAEACSGIRFLMSSIVTGTLFASIAFRSARRRISFVLASLVVPVFANGIRAYGIILIAYLSNNRLAAGVDHLVYGAIFTLAIQFVLIWIGLNWREDCEPPTAQSSAQSYEAHPASKHQSRYWGSPAIVCCLVVLFAMSAPLTAYGIWQKAKTLDARGGPPLQVHSSWEPGKARDTSWASRVSDTEGTFVSSYAQNGKQVDVVWALHSGSQHLTFGNAYDSVDLPAQWSLVKESIRPVVVDNHPATVSQRIIQSGEASRLVWTWFQVGGEYTASKGRVKFALAKMRLMGRSAAVVQISLGIDIDSSFEMSQEALSAFVSDASFRSVGSPQLVSESLANRPKQP